MRTLLKKILHNLPVVVQAYLIILYESYFRYVCYIKEKKEYSTLSKTKNVKKGKKRILVYHVSGLGIGGTEKTLQTIVNNLCTDFDIFFLYSNKDVDVNRRNVINKHVQCIEFDYTKKDGTYPFYIHGMNPHIKNIIIENNIDLLITADSGYTQYPINTILNIPIILINIFGSPSLQKNILSTLFISNTVQKHSEKYTGTRKGNQTLYIPITLPPEEARVRAEEIRNSFGISKTDFVFGRIGRNSDSIFDPIGINAFKKIVSTHKESHYIIMSPPPVLEKIVKEENIPNVHFLPPSGNEVDIWGFHYSLDSLAHFRNDGETFGLNIVESMYAGNPIISHRSHIWNAHLEYLNKTFSRVVNKDDSENYAHYMQEFINLKRNNPTEWKTMRDNAHNYARNNFLEKQYTDTIKQIINNIL